ncbi:MAG: hypothetical protein CR962_00280 [Gammaproteobacteria bacterium]|nr:MAG: hypothetical protein CR962_00280 [Gammaproteobacteria bacterium]
MYVASKITRTVYALSLLIIATPFCASKFDYALILLKQLIKGNPNIINPLIALCYMAISLVIGAIVLYRIYEIIRGRVTLSMSNESSIVGACRVIGLVFMYLGVIVFLGGIAINLSVEGATYVVRFVLKHFVALIMAGVIIFEFSRIKSQEIDLL